MGGLLATALYWYLFQSKPVEKTYEKFHGTAEDDKDEAELEVVQHSGDHTTSM